MVVDVFVFDVLVTMVVVGIAVAVAVVVTSVVVPVFVVVLFVVVKPDTDAASTFRNLSSIPVGRIGLMVRIQTCGGHTVRLRTGLVGLCSSGRESDVALCIRS